jgi:N-acetyl-gamma-glutamyl-phosphate reductase
MKPKIFVDGQEGTTGLRIHEALATRADLEVLKINPDLRRDPDERRKLLNAADMAFLCLPDGASREAVAMIDNPRTRVIDASTAFRTDPMWAYGLPELTKGGAQRARIRAAKRVAVPGCHASAFILAIHPLVAAGIVPSEMELSCFSLTGYSGGGKKMIAAYEAKDRSAKLAAPRHYALKLAHKHQPEMRVVTGLQRAPLFSPVVCDVHSGLALQAFLPVRALNGLPTPAAIHATLAAHFAGEHFVRVMPLDHDADLDDGFFDMTACNGTNRADIFVLGNADQITVLARIDNLGKGASGAAVQCMNLLLGCDEGAGLSV